ncbi:hypothetical protein HD554DRAFT_2066683 [Boletus coccyginus]|nr:hypothetical protein HD554DRAFT_2066683 [Boletus coccyginus]
MKLRSRLLLSMHWCFKSCCNANSTQIIRDPAPAGINLSHSQVQVILGLIIKLQALKSRRSTSCLGQEIKNA